MSGFVNYSVNQGVLEMLLDRGRPVDMSHHIYAKYVMLAALEVLDPSDVALFKKQYERRAVDEKLVASFAEKVKQVKPWTG